MTPRQERHAAVMRLKAVDRQLRAIRHRPHEQQAQLKEALWNRARRDIDIAKGRKIQIGEYRYR